MSKNQIVSGIVTITFNFKDVFPEEWDDEQIIEWVRKNYDRYIDGDGELEDIEITDEQIDNYGSDELYEI